MVTLKIGTFPGELKTFAVDNDTTVKEALSLAGIAVAPEQEIKLDGTIVGEDDYISSTSNLLLVTKRLKGAR